MMEVDEDREDGWGVFDCEIFDSKVAYMVELVKSGYKFKTGEWGGGDAAEPLYVHNLGESEVKRKIRKLTHKEEAGPVGLRFGTNLFHSYWALITFLDWIKYVSCRPPRISASFNARIGQS